MPPLLALLRREGMDADGIEVSLVLCDDLFIQALNLQWRGLDKPTDVLSFAQEATSLCIGLPQGGEKTSPAPPLLGAGGAFSEPRVLGDIVISLDTAGRQADAVGWPVENEVALLAVHGLLHLLGYDDADDDGAAQMQQKTVAALTDANIALPPPQTHPFLVQYAHL